MIRHRFLGAAAAAAASTLVFAAPAVACGGLIAPNGTVHLLRTTTLAAYHDGVEHYITSFQFVGGGGAFGSIVPLPAVPTKVERAGGWTLQRLERETTPVKFEARVSAAPTTAAAGAAQELLNTTIDALDITVLKGGGAAVGDWARQHGFTLTPDAPEMLDYYASRSQIFLAARFDGALAKAKGQNVGDGTPIDITMPLANPWVPLRILTLGRAALDNIQADVYLLTDRPPALLPVPSDSNGMSVSYAQAATDGLLSDLRGDKNMGWIPAAGWLTEIKLDAPAFALQHDLAVDASGGHRLSRIDAGLISTTAGAATGGTPGRAHVAPPLAVGGSPARRPLSTWLTFGGLGGSAVVVAVLATYRRRVA
jgi:hypothetical protein